MVISYGYWNFHYSSKNFIMLLIINISIIIISYKMEKTAILFGSTGGTTQSVANLIAKKIVGEVKVFDVANLSVSDIEEYKNLILGSSTWGVGDLQDDWEEFLPDFSSSKLLEGKTVALFGLGDSQAYPDSFVDGIGTIYEEIKDKGCSIIGEVATEGYDFEDSKAVYEGKFIGLPIDEDNESDLTDQRISDWLSAIESYF